jgi:hypothetical protein
MATHASFVEALIRAMASRVWARSASIAALLRPCFSALALPFGAPRFRDSRGAELILLSGKKFEGGIPPRFVPFRCFSMRLARSASLRESRWRGSARAEMEAAL